MSKIGGLDIEVYDKKDDWEQGKYLVHGYDDVLWTDELEQAISFLKSELKRVGDKT